MPKFIINPIQTLNVDARKTDLSSLFHVFSARRKHRETHIKHSHSHGGRRSSDNSDDEFWW